MAATKFWNPGKGNKLGQKFSGKDRKRQKAEGLKDLSADASTEASGDAGASSVKPAKGFKNMKKGKFSGAKNMKKVKNGKKVGKAALKLSGGVVVLLAVVALAGYFFVVRPATKVLAKTAALKRDAQLISEGFVGRDLVQVSEGLDKMENDMHELEKARDENLGWLSKFGPTKPYYQDSESFFKAGEHLIAAGREAVVLSEPFADAVGLRVSSDEEVVEQSLMDAFSSWVSVMPKIAEDSDEIISQLSMAGEALERVDPSRYPKEIRGMEIRSNIKRGQSVLTQLNEAAPDVKKALTLIPVLLGTEGEEIRYMIIMQNDKEIRPTGGFWTNYATFKVKNALLTSDFTSKDMYSIDLALESIDSYYDFPDAPAPYTKYLKVEHLFARDTNTSPDYPTSIANFMEFYDMGMKVVPSEIKPVSGVFAIDTNVLAEIMEITGPVTVNGVTYDSDNVVLELERIASLTLAQQSGRKRVLGYLMEAMLINLFESDKNLWPKLIEKGVDLAVRKHVLVYLDDSEAQALVEKYNLGGTIREDVEGDYAYVVQTNLGGDKTNWFVEKDVTHNLSQEGNRWVKTVSVTYSYPEPSGEYAAFVKRFADWTRLYVPSGSELIAKEGFEDEFGGGSESGKDYFDGYLTLGPGETKTVTFKYYLPEGVIVEGAPYKFLIQKQPGIVSEDHFIEIGGETTEVELTKDFEFTKVL
ncbi:DUF4012 domain-containing protein [candidate division WWE3 bacterium]|nr:DUF4012 domain-containing protein [candidate division WWE3 bacterium]